MRGHSIQLQVSGVSGRETEHGARDLGNGPGLRRRHLRRRGRGPGRRGGHLYGDLQRGDRQRRAGNCVSGRRGVPSLCGDTATAALRGQPQRPGAGEGSGRILPGSVRSAPSTGAQRADLLQ